MLKFLYSEKATEFCKIFPLLLTVCTVVKSKGKISQNIVAFSEYMNFKIMLKFIYFEKISQFYLTLLIKFKKSWEIFFKCLSPSQNIRTLEIFITCNDLGWFHSFLCNLDVSWPIVIKIYF